MYRCLVGIILLVTQLAMAAAEPYCNVTTYGHKDGVPSSSGSRTVQDRNGCIWISTWNGLYRFDGYEFRQIRPDIDNEVRKYSSRFRDIKMGPDGKMWCRIDDNIVLFDVDNYIFYDLHSGIEERLGERVKIENAIRETRDGDIALNTSDGRLLVFDTRKIKEGTDPAAAFKVPSQDEPIRLKTAGFHKTPLPPSFAREDVAYSKKDDAGRIWCVTKDGRIKTGSNPNDDFKTIHTIDTNGSFIKYSCEDNQGNVWMISNAGIHKIEMGTSPLTYITPPEPSQLRASMTDSHGRIWMSWSDSEYVTVTESPIGRVRYLGPDGSLSATPVKFGAPVYSMSEGPDRQIWLGSKPEGLFRLTPYEDRTSLKVSGSKTQGNPEANSSFRIDHLKGISAIQSSSTGPSRQYDNYYDMAFDGKGRLWLATLGNGVEMMENPSDPNPRIMQFIEGRTYPQAADKARRLRIIGDTMIVATTTEGLLSFPLPPHPGKDETVFRLHRSAPGDEHALGNIATMDAIVGKDGRLYVATESDGLNILTSPLSAAGDAKWKFAGSRSSLTSMPETALTLCQLPDGRILVVGKKDINVMDPEGRRDIEVLGQSFWKRDLEFKEVSPLHMPDGRWLIGLSDGAVTVDLGNITAREDSFPIDFTSYNIEGGPAIALSPLKDTITLQPHERAMTLTFAALCYSDTETIRYAYRTDDDDEWIPVGPLRTLTFTRLQPGEHRISVRSTDPTGRWLDNARSITINVKPTFLETRWAKLLYAVAALSLILGGVWLWLYIRDMKRRQKETLDAYLSLLEARTSATYENGTSNIPEDTPQQQSAPQPEPEIDVEISDEDKALISQVVVFIERNFSDSGITVDDMANAVAVSKSSLTRKMKSLMGVTPADFLKTTRLSKAKIMLKETQRPIKEIAVDCGFSDMNYFGKCFKTAYGVTPGNFRKTD